MAAPTVSVGVNSPAPARTVLTVDLTGSLYNPYLKLPKYPFNLHKLPYAVTVNLTFSWCTSHGAVSHAVAVFLFPPSITQQSLSGGPRKTGRSF